MSKKIYAIEAPCHQSTRLQGFQDAPKFIKEVYQEKFDPLSFSGSKIDKEIILSPGYGLLYNNVLEQKKKEPDTVILTVGGDHGVSASSVGAINDYYMKQRGKTFVSDLVVIWIDAYPDLHNYLTSPNKDLPEMVMTSLLGLLDPPMSPQKLSLQPDQIIYLGVQEIDGYEMIGEVGIQNFTVSKIKTLGPQICLDILKEIIADRPVHISLDMKVFDKRIAPCICPQTENGLELSDLVPILIGLRDKIVSMDLVEYNPRIGTHVDSAKTATVAKECLISALGIKQQRLNIFNEDSHFLIYRPLNQEPEAEPEAEDEDEPEAEVEDEDEVEVGVDIGWYLLRGLDMSQKEQIMSLIPDDKIVSVEIDGEDYLVAKTTINEQNEKSYFCAQTIYDVALFPEEKVEMGFVLLQ